MAAVCGLELAFVLKLLEGAFAVGRHKNDITALTPVTTVRSSLGDKLLAPEAHASASTVPGLNGNGRFIDKFHAS
jgi:hypothetical protein